MTKTVPPSLGSAAFTCPHCEAISHQNWLIPYGDFTNHVAIKNEFSTNLAKVYLEGRYGKNSITKISNIFVSQCFSCKELTLWGQEKMLFPFSSEIEGANSDMPDEIKAIYDEARLIFTHSPRASAALLRLCIEKICVFLNAQGNNLNEKIGDLVQKGLDERVQKALDSVRVIGNDAIHSGQINLNDNRETPLKLFRLVNIIIQQLITDVREVDEIYNIVPDSNKAAIQRRDAPK